MWNYKLRPLAQSKPEIEEFGHNRARTWLCFHLELKSCPGDEPSPAGPLPTGGKEQDTPRWQRHTFGYRTWGNGTHSPPDVTKPILTYSFVHCFWKAVNQRAVAKNTNYPQSGIVGAELQGPVQRNFKQNPCRCSKSRQCQATAQLERELPRISSSLEGRCDSLPRLSGMLWNRSFPTGLGMESILRHASLEKVSKSTG